MFYELERVLIETALSEGMAQLDEADRMPVQYTNTPFQPNAATGFVRVTIMGGRGSLMAIVGAESPSRFPGVLDFAIFTPRRTGGKQARMWADRLSRMLGNRSLESENTRIVTFSPRLETIGEAGDWHQANLSIPFQHDAFSSASSEFSNEFA